MAGRIPLRNRETTAVQFLIGLAQEASEACKTLKDRLDATGQTERLKKISEDVLEVAADVLSTVPLEKLETIKANMACLQMEIHTKRITCAETETFTYVKTSKLRELCVEAAEGRCAICLGSAEDANKCKFRDVLHETLMVDLPSEYGRCEYRDLEWGDSD